MGRPPCSEKTRVKKGPWSPEEDLLLVSYVQEHGAGNWHVVPANTGLMRCSKSCRLRWTNYLCPGIKRGNFSDQEEKVIIKLQQLLGNRWSAIASYMPDRTDNDIKNYWNTHMKKKLAKTSAAPSNKGQWEHHLQTDFHTARQVFQEALSMDIVPLAIKPEPLPPAQLPKPDISLTMYPSSIKNIARLLEAWMCPNASAKASVVSPVSGGGEGGSRSNNGMTHMLEGFTGATKVEGTSGAGPGPSSSLPMGLECWLLDDGMGRGDTGLIGMLLVDPCGFF